MRTGRYLYFQEDNGSWCNAIKIKSDEELDQQIYKHRNEYYKYMLITYENDAPIDYKSGLLEHDKRKVKKK